MTMNRVHHCWYLWSFVEIVVHENAHARNHNNCINFYYLKYTCKLQFRVQWVFVTLSVLRLLSCLGKSSHRSACSRRKSDSAGRKTITSLSGFGSFAWKRNNNVTIMYRTHTLVRIVNIELTVEKWLEQWNEIMKETSEKKGNTVKNTRAKTNFPLHALEFDSAT